MVSNDRSNEAAWTRWRVSGRVQGVGFRWFVRRAATRLGLVGDVRNLADGGVEIRVLGDRETLDRLLDDVRRGPSGSRVDDVETLEPQPIPGAAAFEIRR